MEARELRIGNWVQHVEGWSYRSDTEQHFDFEWNESDWYALGECTLSLDNVEPIPLTEEWLLKFGFSKNDYDNYESHYFTELNDRFIILNEGNGYFYVDAPNRELRHVHQLQNLYFALTGDDLVIK